MPTREKHSTFVCLFNFSSGICLQSKAVSAELWKAFRGQEKLGQEEKKGTKSTSYTASDQLPQASSCINLTLQCAEQDILLSSTKNRFESHQTLNSQKEEICHYKHLSKKYQIRHKIRVKFIV